MQLIDAPFYAFSISDNIAKTPEGYLICRNVPIARTGVQKYLGQELGFADRHGDIINVYRNPEDVFCPESLSSFEGKPITDDHPPTGQFLEPGNYSVFSKGHIQNIRCDNSYVIADLVITDPELIKKVEAGKRQVSVGYDAEWVEHQDGYRQINIRANHLAVVMAGRAGPKVSIKDSLPVTVDNKRTIKMDKNKAIAAMFAAYAKDASPEELQEVAQVVFADAAPAKQDETSLLAKLLPFMGKARDEEAEKKEDKAEDEEPEEKKAMDARFKSLEDAIAKLTQAIQAKDSEEHPDEEADKKLIEKMLAEDEEPEDKVEDEEPEEGEKKEAQDASVQALVKALKPALAKMPARDQEPVKQALAGLLGRSKGSAYAGIQKAVSTHRASDSVADMTEIGRKIAQARNPHYKK